MLVKELICQPPHDELMYRYPSVNYSGSVSCRLCDHCSCCMSLLPSIRTTCALGASTSSDPVTGNHRHSRRLLPVNSRTVKPSSQDPAGEARLLPLAGVPGGLTTTAYGLNFSSGYCRVDALHGWSLTIDISIQTLGPND